MTIPARRTLMMLAAGAGALALPARAAPAPIVCGGIGTEERAARGATLHATAAGPICYMKLAPGRYRIEGELNGVTRSARAVVPADARRPVRIALAFPQEAARDGLGPQPTPEEREEEKTP